jgi:hypothetical protein
MRGKLRDKRTEAKRDIFQREVFERKRPTKRDNRSITWLIQELEDDDLLDVDENEVAQVNLPKKQTPKKK